MHPSPHALRPSRRAPFLLSILSLSMAPVWAQDAAPASPPSAAMPAAKAAGVAAPATALGEVVITGRSLSARRAIAEKRSEPVVSDGISSDEIGSIPDFGLGEALQRVPGTSMIVNNGRGEAQYMTLRGFNPDYNSVTIDGIALPSTETNRRVVSLDVIPSSLARQVTVFKTFTPEMEGNAIGGITNLRTRSAFDQRGLHRSLRADLSEWTNHPQLHGRTPSGMVEGTISNTFGDHSQFGALFSGSYFRRASSSLNTSVDSYSYFARPGAQATGARLNPATADLTGATAFPDRVRPLTYDNVRERRSLFGKLEYDGGGALRAHLTGGWFQHLNDEDRRSQWLQNGGAANSPVVVGADGGSAAIGQSQTDYAAFRQNRQLRYLEAGAEYQPWDDGLLDFSFNSARGSYRQDAQLYTFASASSDALAYTYTMAPGGMPVLTPVRSAALFDASRYLQTENTVQAETSSTRQNTFKANLAHNLSADARGWGFKGGLQLRNADKRYDYDELRYNPASGQNITLGQVGPSSAVVTPYTSGGRPLLLVDPGNAAAYFDANRNRYVLAASNAGRSLMSDFGVDERVQAGYGMTAYQADRFTATAGARIEHVRTDINSFIASPLNQTTTYAPVAFSSSRTDVLPSLNLTWDARSDLRLRAGASRSLARPVYSDLAQNSSSVSGNIISTTVANPDLQPRKSRNLDLSAEWYPSRDSMVSVALFNKRIQNEIARVTSTTPLQIGQAAFTQNVTQAINAGSADVSGLELGVTDVRFDFLPAPFNAFGMAANYTVMAQSPASVRMANGSSRDMPALQDSPKRIANLSLLWGQGDWSGQVAYNYTGKTLISLSNTNAAQDVYYAALKTVDTQLRYRATKEMSLSFQVKNLTSAKLRRVTGPGQSLLNQEIDNGRSFWLGVSYAL
ncbi:TonB-dependent receptor [Paracidovorax oryzae]|uniref:TonB-dependent receptor n=1 Tax=Paracidovorax oryzae TaxID=862720 RepID=UPI0035D04D32